MKHYMSTFDSNCIMDISFYGSYENISQIASVIIVTYNTDIKDLDLCLNKLKMQNMDNFEVILVDNNDQNDITSLLPKHKLKYIKLKKNYGVNVGRNIGVINSNGNIIVFLDDDAIPDVNFVQEHLKVHKDPHILAVRGKVLPKSENVYNFFAYGYDLGNEIIPWMIDIEGNSSFKKEVLLNTGGFNPDLWGHEGIELTYRIIKNYGNKNQLLYSPGPVIYHDYSHSLKKYLKKQIRHNNVSEKLSLNFPDIVSFCNSYQIQQDNNSNKCEYSMRTRIKIFTIRKITLLIRCIYH